MQARVGWVVLVHMVPATTTAPITTRTTELGRRLVGFLALLVVVALVAVDARAGAETLDGSETSGGRGGSLPSVPAADHEGSQHAAYADLPAVEPAAGDQATGGEASGGEASVGEASGGETSGGEASVGQDAQEPAAAHPADGLRVHVVAPGETPSEIAASHGVSTASLTLANAHVEARRLQPGDTLVVPDPTVPRPLTPRDAPTERPRLQGLLVDIARAYGWNPATVQAVAWVESRWNQHVVSHRGAIGVMQVQPATGSLVSKRIGRELDLHDIEDNVEAGVAYLDLLHERYGSDTRALLAAYHQGPRAVRERGIYRVSHRYADRILHLRDVFPAG